MIAGWGTGKTMFAIFRALILSQEIPNNLGLIVRKEFTDLKDSTIKDFERYTGLLVGTNKEIRFPNGSVIMFRHGAEIDVLKNINLGFFMIEQAEEFETNEQFEMLRGRLRRDIPHQTGFVIGNTNGHNWIWKLWKNNPPSKDYHLIEANTFDNLDNLSPAYIEDMRRMEKESPNQYNRFVLNSWEEAMGDDFLFTYDMLASSMKLEFGEEGRHAVIGTDVARFGADETVFTVIEKKGISLWEQAHIEAHRNKDLMWTVGRYVDMRQEFNIGFGAIDDDGIGGGVTDRLKQLGVRVKAFRGGEKAENNEQYANRRTEGYMRLKEMIEKGYLKILNDDMLTDQLLTIRYKYNHKNQKIILSKDEMRKKGIKSPDRADALMMCASVMKMGVKKVFVPETAKVY